MFKEVAQVIDVQEAKIRIKFDKKSMCSCCRYSTLCGQGDEYLMVDKSLDGFNKGDMVEVGIEEKKTVFATIVLFFAPAVVFLASVVACQGMPEVQSFFIAIGAVAVYYLIVRIFMRRRGRYFHLQILRKVHNG